MKVFYKISGLSISKNIKDSSARFFLLSNNIGGWFIFSQKIFSKYQGFFTKLSNGKIIKTLEAVKLQKPIKIKKAINYLDLLSFELDDKNKIYFYLQKEKNILSIKLEKPQKITPILDIREIFDFPEFGRNIELLEKSKNKIFIKYNYKDLEIFLCFLPLNGDSFKNIEFRKDLWEKTDYAYDKNRDSKPFSLYRFCGLSFKSSGFVVIFGENREKIEQEINYILPIEVPLYHKIYQGANYLNYTDDKDKVIEEILNHSIELLKVKVKVKEKELVYFFAGLPWFFENWTRDEAIFLKTLSYFLNFYEFKENILFKLNYIEKNLFLPSYFDAGLNPSDYISYDGTLMFFKNLSDMIIEGYFSKEKEFEEFLKEKFIWWMKQFFIKVLKDVDNFSYAQYFEQWMDSLKERNGALIEIEFLILGLCENAYYISKNKIWRKILNIRKNLVLKHFYDNKRKIFKDFLDIKGIKDVKNVKDVKDKASCEDKIRPNLFLGYWFFKDILPHKEIKKVFKNYIEHLLSPWGGISTLSKKDPDFKEFYTGENSLSYHNGDCWMFLNNISGMIFLEFDEFREISEKILRNSIFDLLWCHCLGGESEISSFKEFSPNGGFLQLFSATTLFEFLKRYKN